MDKNLYQLRYPSTNGIEISITCQEPELKRLLKKIDNLTKNPDKIIQFVPSKTEQRKILGNSKDVQSPSDAQQDLQTVINYLNKLPDAQFELSFPEGEFVVFFNAVIESYDHLSGYYSFFNQENGVKNIERLFKQSSGNTAQIIAERYYKLIQHHVKRTFSNGIDDPQQNLDTYFFEKIHHLFQTASKRVTDAYSLHNALRAGVLALMLSKHYEAEKDVNNAEYYLEYASMCIAQLQEQVYQYKETIKRQSGANKKQAPYRAAKVKLLELLNSVQEPYSKKTALINALIPEMIKFVRNNGNKPSEFNLNTTIANWSRDDEYIKAAFKRCLKKQ
ncbi:hypothetical protein [Providencia stuartii]|uniref:hypothetical protein n=1 Tax=Providencia stuartii TaxID=588 RepID=UPI00111E93D8|nr:hypothetical protein [Providencia stuartii]